MAKKSKTQKAKASAARAAKKEAREVEAVADNAAEATASAEQETKKKLFSKASGAAESANKQVAKAEKSVTKAEKKPAKQHFQFLKDVRSEMKRVTWPSRQDVLQWSIVVVVALLFFGIYVAILDNAIITPLLIAISGLGA